MFHQLMKVTDITHILIINKLWASNTSNLWGNTWTYILKHVWKLFKQTHLQKYTPCYDLTCWCIVTFQIHRGNISILQLITDTNT